MQGMTEEERKAVKKFLRVRRSHSTLGQFLRDYPENAPCGAVIIRAVNRFIKQVRG